jgi:uncharacterized protein YndB with AHSA1/START domain
MSDMTITKTIFLNADADTIWAYLTDKNKLAEWFHSADVDLKQGSDYALMGQKDDGTSVKKCWGSVIESKRPEKLVYTFTIEPLGGAMTTVTWLLEEAFGGIRITLHHEGIGEAAGDAALPLLMALDTGWDAHFGRLRDAAS